ncbi:MAG TPA: L-dopachrome tautomerase-related protein [Abditibacterium sp.]|jgi:sugar lactone lactonase YvrE
MRITSLFGCGALLATTLAAGAAPAPREKLAGKLETVAQFYGPMPTGVTVSQRGRIFVNFPRWGDNVPFTVAEIVNGRAVAFPDLEINDFGKNGDRATLSQEKSARARNLRETSFVGVQSVVVDARDRLWVLDTGSVLFGPTAPGGPKLVCINLERNDVEKVIPFPPNVALPTSYLNDVRFDLSVGREGFAYITDSGAGSPGGIIVVDLATGNSTRRLSGHPTMQPEPKFVPFVEGRPVFSTPKDKFPKYLGLKSDGIAISADGTRLFYCPLASRRLYSVSTALLRNGRALDAVVANSIIDHGDKGASDGLESDAQNRVYATQYETNSIVRRLRNGLFEPVAHDPRLLWPDTLSLAGDGYLYVISNQLHEQKGFNFGKDRRRKPYSLFRVKVGDATPIRLK